jgi:hypothetical protein
VAVVDPCFRVAAVVVAVGVVGFAPLDIYTADQVVVVEVVATMAIQAMLAIPVQQQIQQHLIAYP